MKCFPRKYKQVNIVLTKQKRSGVSTVDAVMSDKRATAIKRFREQGTSQNDRFSILNYFSKIDLTARY